MLSCASPWWLLLLPVPVLLWWSSQYRSGRRREAQPAILHPRADLLKALDCTHGGRRRVPWWWLGSCMLLLVALSQPRWLDTGDPDSYYGHNIMLAIDASASMQAIDYSNGQRAVSRLDIVKQSALDFLDQRHGDRIGLIVFGDDAYLYAPLTTDISLLKKLVSELVQGLAGDKTAIGDAIALATDKLQSESEQSRFLMLFTDGSNTSGIMLPENATRLARQHGIHIYTIGIGHQGKVLYPQGPVSKPLYSQLPVDEALLRNIAEATGGRYFRAGNRQALQDSIDTINHEQRIELKPDQQIRQQDLFIWPLLLAVLMILLAEFTNRRPVLP